VAALIRLTTFSLPAADNLLGLLVVLSIGAPGQMTSRRCVGAAATWSTNSYAAKARGVPAADRLSHPLDVPPGALVWYSIAASEPRCHLHPRTNHLQDRGRMRPKVSIAGGLCIPRVLRSP
jgi:hypothetical protein